MKMKRQYDGGIARHPGESGVATLVDGEVTVATEEVTADSIIVVSHKTISGTAGALHISGRTAGTSFDITSSSETDDSVVSWFIIEPE